MAEFKEDLLSSYVNADRGKLVRIPKDKRAYLYPNVWKKADGSHDESNLGTKMGPLVLGTATGNYYNDVINQTNYLEVLAIGSFGNASSFMAGAISVSIIYVQAPGQDPQLIQIELADNPDYDASKDRGNADYKKPALPALPTLFKKETDVAPEGKGLPVVSNDMVVRVNDLEKKLNELGKTGNPNAPGPPLSKGLTLALWGVMGLAVVGIGIIIYRAVRKPAGA